MQKAVDQTLQGDRSDRLAVVRRVYSALSPQPGTPLNALLAETLDELIQKLELAQGEYEQLRDMYDPEQSRYDSKLFMFYDDLLDKARHFDPNAIETGGMIIPRPPRHSLADFVSLSLPGFSDVIALSDMLNRIESITDKQELAQRLKEIRKSIRAVPEGQCLTCEGRALLTLVEIWIRSLGHDPAVSPPKVTMETTLLPAGHKCILRLCIESDTVLEYTLEITASNPELDVGQQTTSLSVRPGETEETECTIKCSAVGEQTLVVVLSSSEMETPYQQEMTVEFYDPKTEERHNPYEAWLGPGTPFDFPGRNKLKRQILQAIEDFGTTTTSGFLVIELCGGVKSGKTVLAQQIVESITHPLEAVNLHLSDEDGSGNVERLLQSRVEDLLQSNSDTIPLFHCFRAHTLSDHRSHIAKLFQKAKDAGATRAVFLYKLRTKEHGQDEQAFRSYCVAPLEEEDVRALIEQAGLVGGGDGDMEIRNHVRENSSFLHFERGVVDQILAFAAEYPDLAIRTCEGIERNCGETQCVYVDAAMTQDAIRQVITERLAEFVEEVYADIVGAKKERRWVADALVALAEDPYQAVHHKEISQYFQERDIRSDPLKGIRELQESKYIKEKLLGYRFRNPLHWMICRKKWESPRK